MIIFYYIKFSLNKIQLLIFSSIRPAILKKLPFYLVILFLDTQPTQNTQTNTLPQQPAQHPVNAITSDFFSQAIASALASTPVVPSQASNQVTNPFSHQVTV